jgi:hypothetical protein
MLILKEPVHDDNLPFVFVDIEFRNVSGEPRLIRPAGRARHTRHESSRPDARREMHAGNRLVPEPAVGGGAEG